MFASRLSRTAAAFARRAVPVIAVLGTVALAACGDDDDNGTGPTGVNGMWETTGMYMHVSSSAITMYIDFEQCYLAVTYDVVDIDGDTYTVEYEGEAAGEITLNRSGTDLSVEVDGEAFVLESSDVDPDDLELCDDTTPGGEFDPTLGACTSYPALTLGTPVTGSLSSTDATDPNGYYYDVYRLQIAGSSTVEISQSSDVVDSYVYVYNSAGTAVGFDDDGGEGLDALLTETLGAGCYIVVATSYDPQETGAYQLEANAF